MGYDLLSQVNESAQQHTEFKELVEQTIDALGFDRSEVVCTEDELERFIKRVNHRELLEAREQAMDKAGESEWVRDALQQRREREGGEYQSKKLGLSAGKNVKPDKGQRVILPGQSGIGYIVALNLEDKQVMVRDKGGREFVVKTDELVGPKMVGKEPTWMLRK